MKVRTGQFITNKKFSKGKSKGQIKPSGIFTKGKDKGKARPNYNRTTDTKIIFSLTRQMENDFSLDKGKGEPIKTATGYGVGFKNQNVKPAIGQKYISNAEKAEWLEEKHPGVYKLSENEKQKIRNIADDFISNAFQTR